MKRLWKKLKTLWKGYADAKLGVYAASIAYYFFMSIAPLLILCVSFVAIAGIQAADVIRFFNGIFPAALHGFVETLVHEAFDKSGPALSFSTIMMIWSASKGATALSDGLNSVFGIEETRPFPLMIARSMLAIVMLGGLLAVVMYFVFSGGVMRFLADYVPIVVEQNTARAVADAAVTLVVGIVGIAACFAYLPAGKRTFKSQLPGAVCCVVACGLFSFGFRIYIDNFSNFAVLYGSLATVALFLLWMYLMFYVLLISALLNRFRAEGKFESL